MNAFMFERLLTYVPAPLWWPSRRNRAFHRALGVIEGMVYRTIAERRRTSDPGDDLLGIVPRRHRPGERRGDVGPSAPRRFS
jgi:cytochrome P450